MKRKKAKNEMAVELGRKGGTTTLLKHGRAHYLRMAEKSLITRKKRNQAEFKLSD